MNPFNPKAQMYAAFAAFDMEKRNKFADMFADDDIIGPLPILDDMSYVDYDEEEDDWR